MWLQRVYIQAIQQSLLGLLTSHIEVACMGHVLHREDCLPSAHHCPAVDGRPQSRPLAVLQPPQHWAPPPACTQGMLSHTPCLAAVRALREHYQGAAFASHGHDELPAALSAVIDWQAAQPTACVKHILASAPFASIGHTTIYSSQACRSHSSYVRRTF